jgi:hypothetical protein
VALAAFLLPKSLCFGEEFVTKAMRIPIFATIGKCHVAMLRAYKVRSRLGVGVLGSRQSGQKLTQPLTNTTFTRSDEQLLLDPDIMSSRKRSFWNMGHDGYSY